MIAHVVGLAGEHSQVMGLVVVIVPVLMMHHVMGLYVRESTHYLPCYVLPLPPRAIRWILPRLEIALFTTV
jgi:hypothetical protein